MKKKSAFIFALFLMLFLFPILNNSITVKADSDTPQTVYKQVTSNDQLARGDKIIIVAKDYKVALSTSYDSSTRGGTKIVKYTVDGQSYVIANDETQVIQLYNSYYGAFSLKAGSPYLMGAISGESQLLTKLSIGSSISAYWEFKFQSDGSVSIEAMGSIKNIMRYSLDNQYFACYSNYDSGSLLTVYKECLDAPVHTHNTSYIKEENSHLEYCAGCDEIISNNPHNYEKSIKNPTCSEQGYTTYTCICGHSYVADYVEVSPHQYGEISYSWSEDYTKCSATRICIYDENHKEEETVLVNVEIIDPVCGKQGSKIYTATFTNEAFKTQTFVTSIDALSHQYGEVTYIWNEDYSECIATRKCIHDENHLESEIAKVEVNIIESSCLENGSKTYTATFTNEAFKTQTSVEVIEAKGHLYDEGVITKEPTQEEVGIKTFTCLGCGHSYIEEIEKLPIVDLPIIEPIEGDISVLETIIDKYPVGTAVVSVNVISFVSVLGIILKLLKIK